MTGESPTVPLLLTLFVAYWYQLEPHQAAFYQGASVEERQMSPPSAEPAKQP